MQPCSAISQRLKSTLRNGHITYDILWALHRPESHVFATYLAQEGHGASFSTLEWSGADSGETWFILEHRLLDYDGSSLAKLGYFYLWQNFEDRSPSRALNRCLVPSQPPSKLQASPERSDRKRPKASRSDRLYIFGITNAMYVSRTT